MHINTTIQNTGEADSQSEGVKNCTVTIQRLICHVETKHCNIIQLNFSSCFLFDMCRSVSVNITVRFYLFPLLMWSVLDVIGLCSSLTSAALTQPLRNSFILVQFVELTHDRLFWAAFVKHLSAGRYSFFTNKHKQQCGWTKRMWLWFI